MASGCFCLLGYRFRPRIADIGGARYWRIDPSADYSSLNGIAGHRINTKLIEESWDDMLRLAGSNSVWYRRPRSLRRFELTIARQNLLRPWRNWGASTKRFTP
ncbi:hypothetical protein SBA4_6830002 [Candidatus Sulfopaludibacter sp. SbA4]|nr:hypothetical protein SBA4_6830002 [Candidatus Sulfopaludibacter sp. SbA4]